MTKENLFFFFLSSCAVPGELVLDQCDQPSVSSSTDCSHWSPGLVPLLRETDTNVLFPSINSEFVSPSGQSCPEVVKEDLLASAFPRSGAGGDDGARLQLDSDEETDRRECLTNCTVTLHYECNLSVILLESVDARRALNLSSSSSLQIPQQCGVLDVTCCTNLPPRCLGKPSDKITQQNKPISRGVFPFLPP